MLDYGCTRFQASMVPVTAFANGGSARLVALEVHELKSIWRQ